MKNQSKHIVIDARIRRASTGRPVDRLLAYLPKLDKTNRYTVLIEPSDPLEFKEPNFSVLPCPYKQFSFNPVQQFSYAKILKKLRPDLVFFTMTGQAPLFYLGKSYTFTHDLTMLRYARAGRLPWWAHKLRMAGYRLLFWKGNYFADLIITPSQFVKNDLARHYSFASKKTKVIYEASEPQLQGSAEVILDVAKPFIFHVGSPFPHKNIERLLEAFALLKESRPDLKLVLAGKKEYYFTKLEEQISNSEAADDVIITGFISDAQLKWLYENAECYVLPSLSEGFGLPGLEAMAHSCPLASSKATCLPEIYGNAARYFDPFDSSDIARAVEEIIGSPALKKQLIINGQKQLARYSWEKMSREIYQTWADL